MSFLCITWLKYILVKLTLVLNILELYFLLVCIGFILIYFDSVLFVNFACFFYFLSRSSS